MAEDLYDLLNDALEDFDKPLQKDEKKTVEKVTSYTQKGDKVYEHGRPQRAVMQLGEEKNSTSMQQPKELFDQFFDAEMSQKLQREWQSALKELAEDDPTLASKFKSLSKTKDAAKTSSGSRSAHLSLAPNDPAGGASSSSRSYSKPVDINKIVNDTISGIEKSAEELQNMSSTEAEQKLFEEIKNLGLGGNITGEMGDLGCMEGNFMTMMEGMMGNLLSKDVLYPTMKGISKAYPKWLEKNEGEFHHMDFQRYQKQSEVIRKICKTFEEERDDDTQEVKVQRLNLMMNLVEKMQEYGNPPNELLEQCERGGSVEVEKLFGTPPGVHPSMFNPAGLNPDSCCVM